MKRFPIPIWDKDSTIPPPFEMGFYSWIDIYHKIVMVLALSSLPKIEPLSSG